VIIKNTDYIKVNAFAFYSINGNNLIDLMESSKTEDVCEFLEKIVEQNPGKRIILVPDNVRSHHAKKTISKARFKNITCVPTALFTRSESCGICIENNQKRNIS
jgi:hypothetical protein